MESAISVTVQGLRGLTDVFSGWEKIEKTSGFVIHSYNFNNAFSAVKRDAKVSKRGTIFKWKVHKIGTFSVKNGI